MNRSEHLLSCLAEECSEVAQRVSKALRFGASEIQPGQGLTNAQRIVEEFMDLYAVMEMLNDEGVLEMPSERTLIAWCADKHRKVEKFMRYAEKQGALIVQAEDREEDPNARCEHGRVLGFGCCCRHGRAERESCPWCSP